MTFGFGTIVGLLSWTVVVTLSVKAIATLILLARPAAERLATRDGRLLWWATKIAPLLAVPCVMAVAWLTGDRSGLLVYSLLMVFVAVAVPLAIKRRHRGSLLRQLIAAASTPHTPSPPSRPRR